MLLVSHLIYDVLSIAFSFSFDKKPPEASRNALECLNLGIVDCKREPPFLAQEQHFCKPGQQLESIPVVPRSSRRPPQAPKDAWEYQNQRNYQPLRGNSSFVG